MILALATCTIVTRSCVHLLKNSPDLLVRKAIELSNPNLEVLNIDTSRGVIKVYDKQQKKTLTIDMEQAKQGRIKIIGDDGENISVNGDKGKVEVNDGKGGRFTMEGEGNTRITQSWIPKYPGANKLAAMKATTNGKESGTYQFQTSDAVSKVLEFYESGFQAEGFKVNKTTFSGTDTDGGSLSAEKDSQTATVTLSRSGDETSVVIAFKDQ